MSDDERNDLDRRLAGAFAPPDDAVQRVVRHALRTPPARRRHLPMVMAALLAAVIAGWWLTPFRTADGPVSITVVGDRTTLTATDSRGRRWVFHVSDNDSEPKGHMVIAVGGER